MQKEKVETWDTGNGDDAGIDNNRLLDLHSPRTVHLVVWMSLSH